MAWKQVSLEEAQLHRLYGFSGWLLLIWALAALGCVGTLYNLIQNITATEADVAARTSLRHIFGY